MTTTLTLAARDVRVGDEIEVNGLWVRIDRIDSIDNIDPTGRGIYFNAHIGGSGVDKNIVIWANDRIQVRRPAAPHDEPPAARAGQVNTHQMAIDAILGYGVEGDGYVKVHRDAFLEAKRDLATLRARLAEVEGDAGVLHRSIGTHLVDCCNVQGLVHGDVVRYAADQIESLRASRDEMEKALAHAHAALIEFSAIGVGVISSDAMQALCAAKLATISSAWNKEIADHEAEQDAALRAAKETT